MNQDLKPKMKFAIISPIAGLKQFASLSNIHLVLAQRREPEYVNFYKRMRERGDTLILDNGAYEDELVDSSRLIEMAYEYKAQIVVLPDFIGKSWDRTYHEAMRLVVEIEKPNWEWMYVPQASEGNLLDWMRGLTRVLVEKRIFHIGLPRALNYLYSKDSLTRAAIANFLEREHPNVYVHAFGMDRGNYHELWYLQQVGVESIDSSAPVWRGWNGSNLLDFEAWDEKPIEWDYGPPTPGQSQLIRYNLQMCGVEVPSGNQEIEP